MTADERLTELGYKKSRKLGKTVYKREDPTGHESIITLEDDGYCEAYFDGEPSGLFADELIAVAQKVKETRNND